MKKAATRTAAALAVGIAVLLKVVGGAASPGATFTGDFETGTFKPWTQVACSNYQASSLAVLGPFYLKTPGGQGEHYAQYTIPGNATHKQRCQTTVLRQTTVNADEYYSLMVYVRAGWTTPNVSWGPIIAELNYQQNLETNSGKALALTLRRDHVTLDMSTGFDNATSPIFTNSSDADQPTDCRGKLLPCKLYAIPPGKLVQGKWNEIIVRDYFTTLNTGIVEAWYRVKGQMTWTQSVNLRNVPTLQYDATHSGAGNSFDSIGLYRGPNVSDTPATVGLDGFSRASTFAAVAAELP